MSELDDAYARIGRLMVTCENLSQEKGLAVSVITALKNGELTLDDISINGETIVIQRKETEGMVRPKGSGNGRGVQRANQRSSRT